MSFTLSNGQKTREDLNREQNVFATHTQEKLLKTVSVIIAEAAFFLYKYFMRHKKKLSIADTFLVMMIVVDDTRCVCTI